MLPTQPEIELPLLRAVQELGGRAKPQDVYVKVTKFFPAITDADLAEQDSFGGNKWRNRIRWVRQRLIWKGDLASPEYNVWEITPKGLQRIKGPKDRNTDVKGGTPISATLEDIAESYEAAFIGKILQNLHDLSAKQFEHLAGLLLKAYGFSGVKVTGKTNDGGIDGYGKLAVGLAAISAAFQCKRWQGNVPRQEIDKFRGAAQGRFEQGYFFTTSDFSSGAKQASVQAGAVTIVLINGPAIVRLMIEKQIGIRRKVVEIFEDVTESVFEALET